MIIPLQYRFAGNGRIRTCGFDDSDGTIGAPAQQLEVDFSDPNLRNVGYVVHTSGGYDVKVIEAYPYFFVEPASGGGGPSCDLAIEEVIATQDTGTPNGNPANGSLTVNVVGNGYFEYRITKIDFDSGWISVGGNTHTFNGLTAGDYTVYVRDLESEGCQKVGLASVISGEGGVVYDDLVVSAHANNETAPANNDGRIDVNILAGSGSYRITWSDLTTIDLSGTPNGSVKHGLAAGSHTITVEDLITGQSQNFTFVITEPLIEPVDTGDFLEVPILNPIHFSIQEEVDNITVFQSLDNLLLCNQRFGQTAKGRYNQKIVKTDIITIQFNSNFPTHTVKLKDKDGTIVKTFGVVKKLSLSDYVQDFAIRIRAYPGQPTKSKVSFIAGSLPVPVEVGDVFNILNNADGFNGSYEVTAIEVSETTGTSYLIINLTYDAAGATSAATGRFLNNEEDYDVFETVLNFSDVANGFYYLEIIGSDQAGNFITAVSEPIDIKASHPNTVLIEYSNADNCFDMSWETGFIGVLRVDALIGHKRITGGERSVVRNGRYDIIKTDAKKSRILTFEVFMIPPYLQEKLGCIFDLDTYYINKVQYQSVEGTSFNFNFKSLLASGSIELEQIGWFRKFNSHDVGSISDGGFITRNGVQGGYIKR